MKTVKISKIHVGSAVKVGGTLTILLSFVGILIYLGYMFSTSSDFSSVVKYLRSTDEVGIPVVHVVLGILIIGPAILGIWGMFFSFLAALFFNFTIKLTGGLHFVFEESEKKSS